MTRNMWETVQGRQTKKWDQFHNFYFTLTKWNNISPSPNHPMRHSNGWSDINCTNFN